MTNKKAITMSDTSDNITIYGQPLPDNGKDWVLDVALGNAPSSAHFVPFVEMEELSKLESDLKPRLTPDFLQTLVQAARTYGWSGDYTEIYDFVRWCEEIAGKEQSKPEALEPFDDD